MENKEIKRKLFDKLKEFYNDKDFVGGVISNTKTDEERQVIIDYIDKGENVTTDKITLLGLSLKRKRIDDSKVKQRGGNDSDSKIL